MKTSSPISTAFSLIELLIVIAIIGVMASLVIASFSNATQDARGVVALQQQAVLQEALNAWITSASSGTGSLQTARDTYTGEVTNGAKFALFESYLTDAWATRFETHPSVADALATDEMQRTGQYVKFSAWAAGDYPKVELLP